MFEQKSDTGLELNLLQKYIFIPLDIFKRVRQNKGIKGKLEAWLTFLSSDEPEDIVRLITDYPEFKVIYDEVYNLCLNVEKVMEMFSKELKELDQNTVQLMIDEMQEEIESQKRVLSSKDVEIESQRKELESKDDRIRELEEKLKAFTKEMV